MKSRIKNSIVSLLALTLSISVILGTTAICSAAVNNEEIQNKIVYSINE